MDSEAAQSESISTLKLPLFSISSINMASPEHPGMLTPPLQTSLSVPFRWEEEPGKPRPCLALTTLSTTHDDMAPKCLELPPRMLLSVSETKLPSPTTVLEGPYVGRQRFRSSSFRMGSERFQSSSFRMGSECYGRSFSPERERGSLAAMVLSKRGFKVKSWFGSWRRRVFLKGNKEASGGSYVFPSSVDRESDESSGGDVKKMTKIRRGASFSSLTIHPRSHFWATICEGLKQAVPWKNKKLKRGM
ncbi:hypothetical protein L484_023489 [Morus notabilis]|uniref:Uncharacterized protein n=1 Tax=Morus notabilis TaxID=981085 RepID=W9RLJ7_9ROSA|nr:uncharacterized protein At4g00950 [Morus notabilis]EXB83882.1 hypothetical protein L484_023489 [Morus notabilis]